MELSELGKIVESEWVKTPGVRPDMKLTLGPFVVMPDHFHAIIIIGPNDFNQTAAGNHHGRDAMHGVSTTNTHTFGPQRKNLSSVIRGFKSAVTTYARKNRINFGWQTRFHDRIIRDDAEFSRIAQYIENNPAKWMSNEHTMPK